jgi:hypothetical protein
MKKHIWGKIFVNDVNNLYLTPVLVWSKKYRILAFIWLKFQLGILL